MKRKIALFSIYILEIVFGICYYVKDIWNAIINVAPFMSYVGDLIGQIIRYFKGLINIKAFKALPVMVQSIIVVLILTILFTIVFSLFFGIIGTIQKKARRNILSTKAQKVFTLSSEERAKFEWKLYIKKFPIRRLISLIVPLTFFCLFLIVRFDKTFCEYEYSKIDGFFNIYNSIKPYLSNFVDGIEYGVSMYISFNNRLYEHLGVEWVEWIILAISLVITCLLWWGLFTIFAKPFSHFVAKRKAQKAKNNYIEKMEIIEYRTWKKAQREMRVSNKAKEFYSQDEFNNVNDVDSNLIGQSTNNDVDNDNKKLKENSTQKEIDYLDDISTGVVDLGIVQEDNDEVKAPILSRETHFIGDEEIDIVLEKEPIIETIEEEEVYFDNQEYQDTFERYQPDNLVNIELDDKIKKYSIDLIDEEEVVRFDEEHPVINEYQDNTINNVVIKEEVYNEDVNFQNNNSKFKPIVKNSNTKKIIKPINLNANRQKVVEYIINNNKVKTNNNLVNEVVIESLNNDDNVEMKNANVLKPVIKNNKNKKPIKPIAPMKVGRK